MSLSSSRIPSSTLYMSVLNIWLSVRANNKIIFWSFNRFLVLTKLLFYASDIFSTIPTTRSGSIADDSTVPIVNFANQMDNYIKSSEIFKTVIIDALSIAVSEALNPLQAEISSLKSEVHSLRDQLFQVKTQANDNEQYSRRNNQFEFLACQKF